VAETSLGKTPFRAVT